MPSSWAGGACSAPGRGGRALTRSVLAAQVASFVRPGAAYEVHAGSYAGIAFGTEGGVMWFRHRGWIPVAWLLCIGNVASVWFAARPAEPWHATVHAAFAVLFALGAQRLSARQRVT